MRRPYIACGLRPARYVAKASRANNEKDTRCGARAPAESRHENTAGADHKRSRAHGQLAAFCCHPRMPKIVVVCDIHPHIQSRARAQAGRPVRSRGSSRLKLKGARPDPHKRKHVFMACARCVLVPRALPWLQPAHAGVALARAVSR